MANRRLGGITSLTIDGQSYPLRGNMTVTPGPNTREGVAGQDRVHGFTEKPVVPGAKGDISTVPGLSVAALQAITDSTVIIAMANGTTWILRDAWTNEAFEIDTAEGKFGVDFGCMSCDELL